MCRCGPGPRRLCLGVEESGWHTAQPAFDDRQINACGAWSIESCIESATPTVHFSAAYLHAAADNFFVTASKVKHPS